MKSSSCISEKARHQLLIEHELYMPENSRVCSSHLLGMDISPDIEPVLTGRDKVVNHVATKSPALINDLLKIIQHLSNNLPSLVLDFDNMDDGDNQAWTGWDCNQFNQIHDACSEHMTGFEEYLAKFAGCKEKFQHIRVVFTGREGVGKTTLCHRLQDKDIDLALRMPTLGADLHQNWLTIDWESKQWDLNENSAGEVLKTRLGSVIKKAQPTGRRREGSSLQEFTSQTLTSEMMAEISDVQRASERARSNVAFVSLWDMGGHLPFQATHNVFISAHGIYLLVFRLTDFLNDKQEADRLKKWIRMIGTFSAVEYNAPKLKEHHPPLIFVGTFLDELKEKFPEDYNIQIRAIYSSIAKFPELSPHKFAKFCTIDNTLGTKPDDQNLEKLRELITDLAEYQDQWGRELPAKWLQLEMDLLKRREEGTKVLTLKEVQEMNRKSFAPLHDVDEIKIALE
ncbi:probable serine/threonine-protein kinase qkgA [Pecten maximus]|uniref:probable serine/threonine-protein kinase qkgA n=1 Tax=Pecten maximus TaxID=6579 RepID=UPI001458CDF3|nr:probable serine/threonine-protein kinase qkgA [Pecten maximus]